MKIKPVILCGGAGTRLWSESEKKLPKQFIDWGGWTLFGKTLERIKGSIFDYPIITTNAAYLKLVKKYLKKHKIKKYQIMLEPFKRNTAPAILSSALIQKGYNNQPMLFLPSDNLIGDINQFNKSISTHKKCLSKNNIFIFGNKTISPSSEYGYFLVKKISKYINKVIRFIEKPDKNKLKTILKKKAYMNLGMFFIRKDSIIANFKKFQKKMYVYCDNAVARSKNCNNIYYLNKSSFRKIQPISFDFAILEKAKNVNGIKLNIPLTDLGNWKEIWKFFKEHISKTNIRKNTYYRPWGKYINLYSGKGFLLKELVINPKSSISLQKHHYRSERWTIISGKPKITINKSKLFKNPNDTTFIPKGTVHRIENLFNTSVKIIEVQTGPILKETDIVRYRDIYGRAN
ncbi:MAG: sugar phosphate nucleotidyltransferase [Pelagibacteraceae bacterium]|jgi:mannose-1-phosphate guanylyltransferase/mannose-6-phosphate isomerase|nr:sugar phosphate nucleotidyltransferase [Pelagibacteraceae bacterium]MDP6710329.1 sugar phosphate nucleotidyltransferase [Pelagibacteraceae bacterium]